MAQANLDKLVKALDKVEAQLSKIEGMMGSSGSTGAGAGAGGASVDAFDALVAQFIPKLVSDGKTIAADVGEHSELFQKALEQLRSVIAKASETKKPSDPSAIIGGLAAAMGAVTEFENKNRKTQHRDHLSAISNGVSALGWVAVEKTPAPFAKEQGETAFMYTNRILTAHKGKEPVHTEWANSLSGFLKELPNYIKQYHTTGLTYA